MLFSGSINWITPFPAGTMVTTYPAADWPDARTGLLFRSCPVTRFVYVVTHGKEPVTWPLALTYCQLPSMIESLVVLMPTFLTVI